MAKRSLRSREKEQQWRQHVQAWKQSGQSVRDYCREHALKEPSFYAWRSELDRRDQERPAGA